MWHRLRIADLRVDLLMWQCPCYADVTIRLHDGRETDVGDYG